MPSSSHQRARASSRPWVIQSFAGAEFGDGAGQFVPVGVVGEDQRQLDASLPGAGPDPHPAGGEGVDRIGEAPRPAVVPRPRAGR